MNRLLRRITVSVVAVPVAAAGVAAHVNASAPPSDSPPPAASSAPGTSASAGLRIMLTNDDGWDGGGLPSLREALIAAGHDVVVFAPADDQSGNSGRMSFGVPLTITNEADGIYSVTGSPADSAEVGLSLAFGNELPDLVISGPNAGANIANASIHSGTVGAAVTAANEGVPAIAVSTNGDPAGGDIDYTITNQLVADMVAALHTEAAGGPLLPEGLALNVNVPFLPAGAQPEAVVTVTDRSYIDLDYGAVALPGAGESVEATGAFVVTPTVDAASDAAAIEDGLVAITFIVGNYDAIAPSADVSGQIAALTEVFTAG